MLLVVNGLLNEVADGKLAVEFDWKLDHELVHSFAFKNELFSDCCKSEGSELSFVLEIGRLVEL